MQAPVILHAPDAQAQAAALREALKAPVRLVAVDGEQPLIQRLSELPGGTEVYAFLTDAQMRVAVTYADNIILRPMPWQHNPHTRAGLLLADHWHAQLERWQTDAPAPLTRLPAANGRILLNRVSIGTALQPPGARLWQKLRHSLRQLRRARLRRFTLTTAKEQTIHLAALNIQLGDSAAVCNRFRHLCADLQPLTGQLTALIFAPRSVIQFFRLVLERWLPRNNERLPQGTGLIRSQRLTITSDTPFPYRHDGETYMTDILDVHLVPIRCRIVPGQPLAQDGSERDSQRLDGVPTDEESIGFYGERPLPLFPHAGEAAFAELFEQIRQGARFSTPFGVLLVLSVLLATLGLFQNSGPVIIGAMILAPMMAPIVSLAMGLIRMDTRLMRQSARTIVMGTLLAIGLAALFTWLMPFGHMTDQMAARTHPTLLDLGVAILSGLAAAYAYSREEVAKSLAGVAIAVALVPPLAVAGIGLGWGDWAMFQNAFLLFLANLVGIVVSAGLLFHVLGFSPPRTARLALPYKLVMLAAIAIPLALTTRDLIREEALYQRLDPLKTIGWQGHALPVRITAVRMAHDHPVVHLRVTTPPDADEEARARLADYLRRLLGDDVDLVIEFRTFYPAKRTQ